MIKVGFAIPGMGSPPSPTCQGGSSHHLSPPALGCCEVLARHSLRPLIKVDAKPAWQSALAPPSHQLLAQPRHLLGGKVLFWVGRLIFYPDRSRRVKGGHAPGWGCCRTPRVHWESLGVEDKNIFRGLGEPEES